MTLKNIFAPIDTSQIEQTLTTIKLEDIVVCTLVSGHTLFGGVHSTDMETSGTYTTTFNSKSGLDSGERYTITIENNTIAGLQKLPLKPLYRSPDSSPIPVWHYPNPIASEIFDNNQVVTEATGLSLKHLLERGFTKKKIEPQGVEFTDDFLLYIDRQYYESQSKKWDFTVVFPGIEVSRPLQPSIDGAVLKSLKNPIDPEKLYKRFSKNVTVGGTILVPQPIHEDKIENEPCHFYLLAMTNGDKIPLMLKLGSLQLPLTLLHKLNSLLTVYAEKYPIEITIADEKYPQFLFARAIGFFK